MRKHGDGGPAYPIPNATDLDGYVYAPEARGMSLRDYFAGQALAGQIAKYGYQTSAQWCYEMADAMLAEREVGRDEG